MKNAYSSLNEVFHRCADSFEVWVWKEGQEKSQGKKSILAGHQTLKMEVSLEPCVFYNIA